MEDNFAMVHFNRKNRTEKLRRNEAVMDHEFLDYLLGVQAELQEKCYPLLKGLKQEELMLINTRAMMHETVEVENELNWKHWKKPVPVSDEAIRDEITDQFIFLMNEINICGMDAKELYDRTLSKMSVNVDRQKSGY